MVGLWRMKTICSTSIRMGAVADRIAAIPEATNCSPQYRAAKVPNVRPIPVRSESLCNNKDRLAFFLHSIQLNNRIPAMKNRSPPDRKGGARGVHTNFHRQEGCAEDETNEHIIEDNHGFSSFWIDHTRYGIGQITANRTDYSDTLINGRKIRCMHVHTMRASVLTSSIQLPIVSLDANTMLVSHRHHRSTRLL